MFVIQSCFFVLDFFVCLFVFNPTTSPTTSEQHCTLFAVIQPRRNKAAQLPQEDFFSVCNKNHRALSIDKKENQGRKTHRQKQTPPPPPPPPPPLAGARSSHPAKKERKVRGTKPPFASVKKIHKHNKEASVLPPRLLFFCYLQRRFP